VLLNILFVKLKGVTQLLKVQLLNIPENGFENIGLATKLINGEQNPALNPPNIFILKDVNELKNPIINFPLYI